MTADNLTPAMKVKAILGKSGLSQEDTEAVLGVFLDLACELDIEAARGDALRAALESIWQPIETAPKDGSQFLALLSNGWYELLRYPTGIKGRFLWWVTLSNRNSIPVVETHPENTDWAGECWILATHWRPLPEPPEKA